MSKRLYMNETDNSLRITCQLLWIICVVARMIVNMIVICVRMRVHLVFYRYQFILLFSISIRNIN